MRCVALALATLVVKQIANVFTFGCAGFGFARIVLLCSEIIWQFPVCPLMFDAAWISLVGALVSCLMGVLAFGSGGIVDGGLAVG